MHDAKGQELKVGDVVILPMRIKTLHATEDYCNVDLESLIGRRPDGLREKISAINTGITIRANHDDDTTFNVTTSGNLVKE